MFTVDELMKSKRSCHINAKRTLTPHRKPEFYDAYKIMLTWNKVESCNEMQIKLPVLLRFNLVTVFTLIATLDLKQEDY